MTLPNFTYRYWKLYRSLHYLKQRVFKQDEVKKGSGVKDSHNWILGKTFAWVME